MTLVSLVDPAAADPSTMPALEGARAQYGTVLNTWRALLHRPAIFTAYLPYLRAVAGPGVVEQRIKELSAVAVAIANHCRYSTSHRVRAARAAGVSDEEINALARGDLSGFSPAERLAIRYARELSLRPPQVAHGDNPQAVAPELLDELRATFPDDALVELTANIALWNALARFHRVMNFPLDMPAPPPAVEAALQGREEEP